MTLALRLLLAFGLLAIVATALVGAGVREAWRQAEEERFAAQLEGATNGARAELAWEVESLRGLLRPVCEHDAFIDQTLVDLERHELDAGRRLAITQLVPEEMKALNLDELTLVTGNGEVLGAGHAPAWAGTINHALSDEIKRASTGPALRAKPGDKAPPALVTRCAKSAGGFTIGLVGARHLGPLLDRIGRAYGVRLTIEPPADPAREEKKPTVGTEPSSDEETMVTGSIAELEGQRLKAAISKKPLVRNLAVLDERITVTAFAAVAVAIVAAILLARTIARPIEALARQAKEVARGAPTPVKARGDRELVEFARAFNQAIEDLAVMRERLQVTERIAARQEIGRYVAHEIKNPLAPIRAAVETLRRLRARSDPAFDEYFDEATRTVLEEVHRITKIVSAFAEFARLPAPNPAPVDLAEVVKGLVALHTAGGAQVVFEGSGASPATLHADRDQLVQVLTNLVQNGLDAAGANALVTVRLEPAGGDAVAILVRDNGPGVSADMLPRLFEPYATTKPHGTGLGLAIVERIVKEHGGTIAYEPGVPTGAAFRVVLPLRGPPRAVLPQPDKAAVPLQPG